MKEGAIVQFNRKQMTVVKEYEDERNKLPTKEVAVVRAQDENGKGHYISIPKERIYVTR